MEIILMCGGQSLRTKPELGLIKPQVMAVHDELSSNWLHNQASNLLFFFFVGGEDAALIFCSLLLFSCFSQ